jgi:SET domain-containing protein
MQPNKEKMFDIKEVPHKGMGLFAAKDFKRGEMVYSFPAGKVISKAQTRLLSDEERRYIDKLGENEFEIVEFPARYVNHSCDPNIEEKERTGYAARDIKKGDELSVDYDKVVYLTVPFHCWCGSPKCRKMIKGKG